LVGIENITPWRIGFVSQHKAVCGVCIAIGNMIDAAPISMGKRAILLMLPKKLTIHLGTFTGVLPDTSAPRPVS
jgi:hypothetical protein